MARSTLFQPHKTTAVSDWDNLDADNEKSRLTIIQFITRILWVNSCAYFFSRRLFYCSALG